MFSVDMSLPDATIDLNLPADHPDHLQEGESILLNVNAFRPLEKVHIRLGICLHIQLAHWYVDLVLLLGLR